jgi:hypothetical protein
MQISAGHVLHPRIARDQSVQLGVLASNQEEPVHVSAMGVEEEGLERLDGAGLL